MSCYFCHETKRLETHHIVPRRFDGEDTDENTVQVCPTCHSKLENLYDKRFYDSLGVEKVEDTNRPNCEHCGDTADGQTANWMTMESWFICEPCAEEHNRTFEVRFDHER